MSTGPGRTAPRHHRRRPATRPRPLESAGLWEAARLATALLAAENLGTGDSQADIIGDVPEAEVLRVLVLMTNVFLRYAVTLGQHGPDAEDVAASFLQGLGLRLLEEASR